MADGVRIPVRECVGAALRFSRENVRFIVIAAAVAAGLITLLAGAALASAPLGLVTGPLSTVVRAFFYAAMVGAALYGVAGARGRLVGDGWRVWAAMALIGLFMFIVMFVLSIPGSLILFAGPLGPYLEDLQSAGQDQAAVLEVMTRFAREQPIAVLLFFLFYAAVWLLLTSRLYLAAPASVDRKRMLTFETWRWTQGNMLAIAGARLMLLGPAYVLVSALDLIVARIAGVQLLDPLAAQTLAQGNPGMFLVYAFVTSFITLAVYTPLEAGLSTALYRGLKPAETALPPAA